MKIKDAHLYWHFGPDNPSHELAKVFQKPFSDLKRADNQLSKFDAIINVDAMTAFMVVFLNQITSKDIQRLQDNACRFLPHDERDFSIAKPDNASENICPKTSRDSEEHMLNRGQYQQSEKFLTENPLLLQAGVLANIAIELYFRQLMEELSIADYNNNNSLMHAVARAISVDSLVQDLLPVLAYHMIEDSNQIQAQEITDKDFIKGKFKSVNGKRNSFGSMSTRPGSGGIVGSVKNYTCPMKQKIWHVLDQCYDIDAQGGVTLSDTKAHGGFFLSAMRLINTINNKNQQSMTKKAQCAIP